MMPIRFPTEAANDPDGKLTGLPESTGEDDTDRGRAGDRPRRQDRDARQSGRNEPKREKDSDSDKGKS